MRLAKASLMLGILGFSGVASAVPSLTFIIDGDIGDEISELTLAYAFFLAPKDPA